MDNAQEIRYLYKKLGETPLECVLRFKKDNPEYALVPMTYAGRLDPMAEGLLLVLSGEAILEKEKYLDFPKTYVFEILWGVSTDSLDILGIVRPENSLSRDQTNFPSISQLQTVLNNSVGKFTQKYPEYSSKSIASKFKGKENISAESHIVEIYSAEFISRRSVSSVELLETIKSRVSLVTGDFRQKETIENWQKIIQEETLYTIDTLEVSVSRGFYVRQFVVDLVEKLGVLATTFHIKRVKLGGFVLEE